MLKPKLVLIILVNSNYSIDKALFIFFIIFDHFPKEIWNPPFGQLSWRQIEMYKLAKWCPLVALNPLFIINSKCHNSIHTV